MHLHGHLTTWLLVVCICPANTICPIDCICGLDDKGRRKVSCTNGGMEDPIPIQNMDNGLEVLQISAPPTKWNKLTIGPIFQNFKHLQEIHIIRSNLLQIGMHSFWGVPTLKVLNLRMNNITVLTDHNFRGLVNLEELNLDDNKIVKLVSGVFRHLSELRILTLERNQLDELVPRLFVKLSKLQVLKLSDNPLLELSPEVFKDILVSLFCSGSNCSLCCCAINAL